MKKIILIISFAILLATSTLAFTYTDNQDDTGNICWNNIPDAKTAHMVEAERVVNSMSFNYSNIYSQFNKTSTIDDLNAWHELNKASNSVTTYSQEKREALRLATIEFINEYMLILNITRTNTSITIN